MKGTVLLTILIALVVVGCAQMREPVTAPPTGIWPDLPCPPDDPILARQRLDDIIDWAIIDESNPNLPPGIRELAGKCRELAEECLGHGAGDRHQPPAAGPSMQVSQAWKHADRARRAVAPQIKVREWTNCRNELDHTP